MSQYRERLISLGSRVRVRILQAEDRAVANRLWYLWGMREGIAAPVTGSGTVLFVSFEPDGEEELVLSFPDWKPRAPCRLALNGQLLDGYLPAGETPRVALPRARLRFGLNHLLIHPATGSALPGDLTATIYRRGSLRAQGRGRVAPPDPPELTARAVETEEALWSGHWRIGEEMASALQAKAPDSARALYLLTTGRLLFVRAARDFTHRRAGGLDDPAGLVADMMRDPETALRDMADGVSILQQFVERRPDESAAWRCLGDVLCAGDEVDLGWSCLTYATLLDPENPETWYAFFTVHDSEYLVHPSLESRRPEIREGLELARGLCVMPRHERLGSYIEKALRQR